MAKNTFPTRCNAGPALGRLNDQVVVCWAGEDPRMRGLHGEPVKNQLSLMPVNPDVKNENLGARQLLPEWSVHRPAITTHMGRLFIAWTGTDEFGYLNIASIPALGANLEGKITFDGQMAPAATSVSGPALVTYRDTLILAFVAADPRQANPKIKLAWSKDGLHWTIPGTVLDHQESWHSPALTPWASSLHPYDIYLLLAWTGTNSHLYLHDAKNDQYGEFDDHSRHQQEPPESSGFGPAIDSFSYASGDWSFRIVWAGTDHFLYESSGGGPSPILRERFGWTDSTEFEPAIIHHPTRVTNNNWRLDDDWIYAWAGTDSEHSLNVAKRGDLQNRNVSSDEWYSRWQDLTEVWAGN